MKNINTEFCPPLSSYEIAHITPVERIANIMGLVVIALVFAIALVGGVS